jgi:hypothetical protein
MYRAYQEPRSGNRVMRRIRAGVSRFVRWLASLNTVLLAERGLFLVGDVLFQTMDENNQRSFLGPRSEEEGFLLAVGVGEFMFFELYHFAQLFLDCL